jgi:hypothetical protein
MDRINPFDEIYKLQNQGTVRAKNESLPDFPRLLDVEITNSCNYRCLMCPTGTGSQTRDKGFMSSEVYQKLIDEVSPQRIPLRFHRVGRTHPAQAMAGIFGIGQAEKHSLPFQYQWNVADRTGHGADY